jgi:hypothetical protein
VFGRGTRHVWREFVIAAWSTGDIWSKPQETNMYKHIDYFTTVLFVRFLLHLSLWKLPAASCILNENSNYVL